MKKLFLILFFVWGYPAFCKGYQKKTAKIEPYAKRQKKIRAISDSISKSTQVNLTPPPVTNTDYCKGYDIITIGNQIWMTQNLDVTVYNDGTPIDEAESAEEWRKCDREARGCWCYYYGDTYKVGVKNIGRHYNWYAVNPQNGHHGIAPAGYHVPSKEEYEQLFTTLGKDAAGFKMKSTVSWKTGFMLKTYSDEWKSNGNGSNCSGWCGFSCAIRVPDGRYYDGGERGYWWTTSPGSDNAWVCALDYYFDKADLHYNYKGCGNSVRCVQDANNFFFNTTR